MDVLTLDENWDEILDITVEVDCSQLDTISYIKCFGSEVAVNDFIEKAFINA